MEIQVLNFIRTYFSGETMDSFMVLMSSLGNSGAIWILFSVGLLMKKSTRKYGVMCLLALVFSWIFCNVILKNLVQRARPFELVNGIELLIKAPHDYSFPSGHTSASFAAAVVAFHMNKKVGIVALCVAAIIGFSRLYLYVHFPSDVIFGVLLGACCGTLAILLYEKIAKGKKI